MRFQDSYQAPSVQDRINFRHETELQKWRLLYFIAGIAANEMLALITVQIAVYTLWPMPIGGMRRAAA